MGMLQRFETRLEQAVSGRLRQGVPQRGPAGGAGGRAAARGRQLRADPLPQPPAGPQHLRASSCRRWTSSGSQPYSETLDARAHRRCSASTPRSSTTSSPGRSPSTSTRRTTSAPAGSGCAARPPPRSWQRGGSARPAAQRPRRPASRRPRGQRHPPPALAARARRRPRHRGRPPDQRPGRQPPARRVPGRRGATADVDVVDLGSTNGTLVDGSASTGGRAHDGATVRVGNTDLVVRLTREER